MLINPYASMESDGRAWIKTNFHTHAGIEQPGNCGELPLDAVIEAYRRAGYGALAISNHNVYLPRDASYTGISVLDAVEYSQHPHMLLVGTTHYHDVDHQQAIHRAREEGAFVILCHPNWMRRQYWPWRDMLDMDGYTGIEIVNPVIYTLKGSGMALDAWDYLLSRGKLVYGFANDDFHQWRDIERAYTMIHAKSPSFVDIKAAVEAGSFYVSTGLRLNYLRMSNTHIDVSVGFFVDSFINTFSYRLIGANGKLLNVTKGTSASFEYPKEEPYVRIEATAENGAMLFLQPIVETKYFVM